ncbi:HEAT repeat domain-containing protein [Cohnella fermenti]|uniref:HEAT repeat domain-containing protein n=1 Tax=Cohnella fermenti TaxID=2565925 RepID=A0A4S4C9L6_9BACL|nr:HEAT repeat domain-containing protein [Cohnella fermenti]THF84427.1 HEAT repeat domain-containing protein [Cohnella fermenti]
MSIELLKQLDHEIRRLFVAGSKLASGDVRLAKLLPALGQIGQSSPVFARIAQAVEQTIDPNTERSSAKLLELAVLIRSILYTQGQTELAGVQTPITGTDHFPITSLPFRELNPVLLALTVKGQGRLEVIHQAHKDGIFRDYRLLIPAVTALDESYSEIADYLEASIIPQYGADALPVLQQQFRPDGGRGHARRLQLIHRILGRSGIQLYEHAAATGSLEVRTAAIGLLGHYPEQEPFLLEQADERRKEVRRAALLALSNGYTSKASDRIYGALISKDRELAVEAIRQSSDDSLRRRTIDFAAAMFDQWRTGAKQEEALDQLRTALEALRGHRTTGLLELLRSLLSDPTFFTQDTSQLQETAAQLLLSLDTSEAQAFAVSLKDTNKNKLVDYSLRAAVRSLSPTEVYDQFHGYFAKGAGTAAAKLLSGVFHSLLPSVYARMTDEAGRAEPVVIDPRWGDIFIKADIAELVCRTAHKPNGAIIRYLKSKCQESKTGLGNDVAVNACLALFHIGCEEAPEVLMNDLVPKTRRTIYYLNQAQLLLLGLLPASYANRLASFAEEAIPYESVRKQVAEVADWVRTRPQDEQRGWVQWITSRMF